MLALSNVNQYYGQSHTLWDINLTAEKGQCLCIMGRNGVGKTTLLKVIMGLLKPQSGNILLNGRDFTRRATPDRARHGIAYVPQGRLIFPQLTVEENLIVSLSARRDKRKRIPEHIFQLFPVLKEMQQRRGGDLSGGQQQQLAIGRALCLDPSFLILDEPTEGIQPNIVHEIGDIILKLNKELQLSVLLVEQKLSFARRVASDFCIMEKGQFVAKGPIGQLDEQLIKRHLAV